MQQAVVDKHKKCAQGVAPGHHAHHHHGVKVWSALAAVYVPHGSEGHIFGQDYEAVKKHTAPRGALTDAEPAEYVHDAHHHVVDDLLPLRHAEVRLTLDDPEGHGAPMGHDENAKVELENGNEEGEGHGAGSNCEQVPQHVHHHCFIRHGELVVSRVP